MYIKKAKELFLPIPIALKECLRSPESHIPLFLSKLLDLSESTTHEELCYLEIDQNTLSSIDANSISAINDFCLNILSNNKLINSKNKLCESINLKVIPIEDIGFKGPGSIKSLKDAGIINSSDLSKITFEELSRLKNFSIRNIFTAAFLLEKYCLIDKKDREIDKHKTLPSINHEDVICISTLEGINSIPLSDQRIFLQKKLRN